MSFDAFSHIVGNNDGQSRDNACRTRTDDIFDGEPCQFGVYKIKDNYLYSYTLIPSW